MKENINWHKIATERKDLRNTLKASGETWKDAKEDVAEQETSDFSRENFLAQIKSGEGSSRESKRIQEIKGRLRELDEIASSFSAKGRLGEAKAELKAEKYSGFYGEVAEMRSYVSKLNTALAERKRQEFRITSQRKGHITDSDRTLLADIHKEIEIIQEEKTKLENGEDTWKAYRAADLLRVQRELKESGFATIGDVEKWKKKILMRIQQQKPLLLSGPTGTGKTELLINTVQEAFGQKAEVLNCHERVGPAEIFGKTLLRASGELSQEQIDEINKKITDGLQKWEEQMGDEVEIDEKYLAEKAMENDRLIALHTGGSGATETYFQPGVLTRCLEKNIPMIMDEFNNMPLNMRFALKEIYNRKEGDTIIIQTDSGREVPVPPNFTFLASANLSSEKHKGRAKSESFKLDDAEARVYKSLPVPFMNQEDQYDISLVSLMNSLGDVPTNQTETKKVLEMLVKTATDTQRGYTDKLDIKDAKGKKATLENAVFDPGQLFEMVSLYPSVAHEKDFLTHLNEEILDFVNKDAYEKDRGHLVYLFQKNGFLQGKDKEDFNGNVSDAQLAFANSKNLFEGSAEDEHNLTLEEVAELDPFESRAQKIRAGGEDFIKNIEGSVELKLEGSVAEQIQTAIEILGEKNVFGPDEVRETWGVALSEVPVIPFYAEELENAKELGQILVLRVDKTGSGEAMSMEAMSDMMVEKWNRDGKGDLLNTASGWKRWIGEDFFSREAPRAGWSLVGGSDKFLLPDSKGKNYIQQTEIIVKTLIEEVFKGVELPKEYTEAISEFESRKDELVTLMSSDWKECTKQLSELKITQLTRHTIPETIYDLAMYHDRHSERLLPNTLTWSASRDRDGGLVGLGAFDDKGVSGSSWHPDLSLSDVGVPLSRRL